MNETNNINEFLDKSMKSAMLEKTKDDFTAKLMQEIELAKAFQKEDRKTFRALNIFVVVFIGAMVSSAALLIALLGSGSDNENPSTQGFLSSMYDYINSFSQKIFSLFGLSLSGDTLFYVMGIGLAIVLYSVVDRLFLKRTYN